MLKYILLDEIELEIIRTYKDNKLTTLMFDNKKEAKEYAEKHLQGWQIIEIPFD